MLIAGAEVAGRASMDVRVADGRIVELAAGLARAPGEEAIEARGGALLPGLHDHHLHLLALAAAQTSVRCGPPEVQSREQLGRALAEASPVDGWVRGVGYHESVAGPLDRDLLDKFLPDRPARVQHRSGALWVLNSSGLRRLGLDAFDGGDAGTRLPGVERDSKGRANGQLLHMDGWLRQRLGARQAPDLSAASRRLARYGVTGVTDATARNGPAELAALEAAVASGALRQRLMVMGGDDLPQPTHPLIERGPRKIMLAESQLPSFDALIAVVVGAHAAGRPVAVHCVTRAQLVLSVEALREAGALRGDRIEHVAVLPPDLLELVAALPLTVVTQPNFVLERGDAYLVDVEAGDRPWLYRAAGLVRAGVPLGAGTDAPFGGPDPWAAMRAAVDRRSAAGEALGPDEALTPEQALALFTSSPDAPGGASRRLAPGEVADLCLLERPWRAARSSLSSEHVRASWRAGCPIWSR